MRHVHLDVRLTDAEARNLLLVIETNSVFEDDETDESWGPLYDLADALRAELARTPKDRMVCVEHDSVAIREDLLKCDACEGEGVIDDPYSEGGHGSFIDCIHCNGTGEAQ